MDGNGRWGQKIKRSRNYGHLKGLETVKKVVNASIKLKIPIISFYVFSTENWNRPKTEISFLFKLINNYFSKEIGNVTKMGIKLKVLGEINKLPTTVQKTLKKSEQLTNKNRKILVNLAINYGSKNEILNAFKKCKKKNIRLNDIEKNLYFKNIPNPDILIRTGGHKRLSNFMLWQLAYTELFFIDKLWPDFRFNDLKKIINKFKKIKRNFGAI
jgi:undecaprenyl diphosphate synthase